MKSFVEAFAEWGVSEGALQTSYAMAENVFAVTQSRLGAPPKAAPRSRVREETTPHADLAYHFLDEVYVSSGPPLEGMEVRIVDGSGAACPAFKLGEVQIRTPCLFSGYWGSRGFTGSAPSAEGWYSTGDYGFLDGAELFVIGRSKDIVIIGGQNIFPEDVEVIVNAVGGVYPGRAVAFGIQNEEHGTESLAVVAELKGEFDEAAAKRLGREIHKTVLAMIGVAPRHVAVVPERWIVKSTAGKISRRETKERFRREKLRPPAPRSS
jgi:acyl-CoA synthetase (AMP-forming)/AMP-acid ligase II